MHTSHDNHANVSDPALSDSSATRTTTISIASQALNSKLHTSLESEKTHDNHTNEYDPPTSDTSTTATTISTPITITVDEDKLHTSFEGEETHDNQYEFDPQSFNSSTTTNTTISTMTTVVVDDRLHTSLASEKTNDDHTNEYDPRSFNSSTTTTTTFMVEDKLGTSLEAENTSFISTCSISLPSSKRHALTNDPCWNAIHDQVESESSTTTTTMLSLHDFSFIEKLGSGDIGTVYLVELKGNRGSSMFAAKVMDKEELMNRNKENRSKIEREILEMLNHPFLPTLYTTIESTRWSCLLTEFCPGGDLHVIRQRQPGRRFDQAAVRFYASEVVVALEYLHMMGIIYRDLKPENVLVRSDGHIMLTDFDLSLKCDNSTSKAHLVYDLPSIMETPQISTSSCILPNCITPAVSCFRPIKWHRRRRPPLRESLKIVAEPIDARSMSFVGTYEYLAPEIVSGEGHGNAVDWWTLGIFIYELIYGVTPFRGVDNEHTMANIMVGGVEFPKEPPIMKTAKDLITQLLMKDPTKRMGSIMGATAIKNHSFFDGVDWPLLRCTTPPYVPKPVNLKDSVSSHHAPVEYF